MTIDQVLALEVILSEASRAGFQPLSEAERVSRAARPTLEGALCRDLPGLAERHREDIATGYPRFWRQSGGYRLDRLPDPARPSAARRPHPGHVVRGTPGHARARRPTPLT